MAVQDDLRRLSQMDSIYLGESINLPSPSSPITGWHKGRVQQANDGAWIFRAMSFDGAIVGFQLGPVQPTWTSTETPIFGIQVTIPITYVVTMPNITLALGNVFLQQLLPMELT